MASYEKRSFTEEEEDWLHAQFPKYQKQFHRKWKELARAFSDKYKVAVHKDLVRNKLYAYWVCVLCL